MLPLLYGEYSKDFHNLIKPTLGTWPADILAVTVSTRAQSIYSNLLTQRKYIHSIHNDDHWLTDYDLSCSVAYNCGP